MSYWGFKPYVSAAQRRAQAARKIVEMNKKGQPLSPIRIEGRNIANSFWGKAWCDNLESYQDFANRLPRGRTYVRNGSVIDLKIAPGKVTALVQGSSLYNISIEIAPLSPKTWKAVRAECAGQIGSLVELLQGKLSKDVMEIVTRPGTGLFPKPSEIKKSCSCPDFASLCKHLAAVFYGIGAKLDHEPELLFKLRQVDHLELIEDVATKTPAAKAASKGKKEIKAGQLADVFGIDIAEPVEEAKPKRTVRKTKTAVASAATVTKKVKAQPKKAAATKAKGPVRKSR